MAKKRTPAAWWFYPAGGPDDADGNMRRHNQLRLEWADLELLVSMAREEDHRDVELKLPNFPHWRRSKASGTGAKWTGERYKRLAVTVSLDLAFLLKLREKLIREETRYKPIEYVVNWA